MKHLAITLRGAHAERILHGIAENYARLWLQDVATVRETPALKPHELEKLADYRFALRSVFGEELPPIPEPDYPVRYMLSDSVPVKVTRISAGGITFDRVDKTKLKPGARKLPSWSSNAATRAAKDWAEDVLDGWRTRA
jgi:hypothetical protein